MADWEFLIQKEGDRSWLPLDTPDVEILEGRYRVVARSTAPGRPVDVRITHDAVYETPPKRRSQSRSGQTNSDGLMMVLPFTRLQPGTWELRCTSDVMADLMGEGWQQRVLLHVLPHEAQAGDDWMGDWSPAVEADAGHEAEPGDSPEDHGPAPVDAVEQNPIDVTEDAGQATLAPAAQSSEANPALALGDRPESEEPASREPAALPDTPQAGEDDANPPDLGAYIQAVDDVIASVFDHLEDDASDPDLAPRPDPIPDQPAARPPAAAADTPDRQPDALPALPLALHLSDDIYSLPRGSSLTLTGHVHLAEGTPPASAASYQTQYQLHLRLTDPQTGRSLLSQTLDLPALDSLAALPLAVQPTLTLDDLPLTHLLLGEATLMAQNTQAAIATQTFTVTVDVDHLLTAIANDTPESELFQPPVDLKRVVAPDLTFLNFLSSPPQTPGLSFQPSDNPGVVPALHPRSPQDDGAPKSLDLPKFAPLLPDMAPSADADDMADAPDIPPAADGEAGEDENMTPADAPEDTAAASSPPPAEAIAPDEIPDDPRLAAPPEPRDTAAAGADPARPTLQLPPIAHITPALQAPPSTPISPLDLEPEPDDLAPEDEAFYALNLGDRFLDRLSSLAQDRELATWLGAVAPASPTDDLEQDADLTPEFNPSPEPEPEALDDPFYSVTPTWQAAPNSWDDDLAQDEIVMDEGDDLSPPTPLSPPEELCLPDDQPIPTPVLDIPATELTAGQATHIRLTLPKVTSKIYVKVWIHDCQQRRLVDGPHWVTNFLPNRQGHLEGSLAIAVPLGCMEARFEAIAVEMLSQRESRKVSVTRLVMPPNLPDLAFDELDV
jgi:hypothetical protein